MASAEAKGARKGGPHQDQEPAGRQVLPDVRCLREARAKWRAHLVQKAQEEGSQVMPSWYANRFAKPQPQPEPEKPKPVTIPDDPPEMEDQDSAKDEKPAE